MLTELRIENLGVIEELRLVIGTGLVAVTGETGAGKTMIVEAIDLLVGGRADTTSVRAGAAEARVEGRFVDGDDEWILGRVIPVDGRSRAYVNGRLATVGQLAEIGTRLVDLHGQHAHQSLLSAAVQRAALDEFGGIDATELRVARARLTEIDAAIAALGGDQRSRLREVELLRYQITEIDAVGLGDVSEDAQLDAHEDRLADASAHREAADAFDHEISADGGVIDRLSGAVARLSGRGPYESVETRLRSLMAELSELNREVRSIGEACEDDPEKLAEIRIRRQALRDLRKKYGETLAEVADFVTTARERLRELESVDSRVEELELERERVLLEERKVAAKVARARKKAAPRLAEAVTVHLQKLAMPKAVVTVAVNGDDPADDVTFELAANPGLPSAPLVKSASGGELARTMLALRRVLSSGPPILVFDEVDAGIGGEAALAVADALHELGERHQVFVVTHLGPVAAAADVHVAVEKRVVDDAGRESTFAGAKVLSAGERVGEIARMLSGRADSSAAQRHARELLTQKSRSS
ncbi:MAG: DNA repair protein RecN [Actinomycetota bacterium]